MPRNEKLKRPKGQEPKRQGRNSKRNVKGAETRCMKMGKHRGWPNRQNEDLQERGSEQSEISSDDGVICCDTGRLSVPGSPDNTHRHTVKHVVSQLFPHSICAKEFEDGFLNASSTMQQQRSGRQGMHHNGCVVIVCALPMI